MSEVNQQAEMPYVNEQAEMERGGDGEEVVVEEEAAVEVEVEDPNFIVPPLLPNFKSHVAYGIWINKERKPLKLHCHTEMLELWEIPRQPEYKHFRQYFKDTGLLNIRLMSYKHPNKNLINAFIERWHAETNSFHLPWGEMTITLDDVYNILGLAVDGKPVITRREGMIICYSCVMYVKFISRGTCINSHDFEL